MKFRRSSLFGLCVLSTLAVFGCNDPESNAKKCYQASDCGNTDEWKCNIETNSCELRQPEHCINTIKDGDEADVNCGGSCLAKCEVGKACTDNDDCGTGNCTDKKVCAVKSCTNDTECVSPAVCWFDDTVETPTDGVCISCVDGIVNGDETDVDCGGNTCAQCEKGKTCKTADDCVTGECTNKTCTGDAPVAAVAGDLVINEVMSNASTSKAFDNIEGSKQCDFVEIVNITDHAVSLDGVILKTKRIGGDEKEASYPLSGSLRSKQAAVINACEDNYFPSDVLSISSFEPAFGLVNTAEGYNISLHIGETEAAKVNFAASTAGHSFNLSKDLEANNPALVLHNTVNADFNNSPGRCSNNQPFSTGCIDVCTNGVKDGDETDTDCGGSCNKCANDKVCKIDADCLTGSCEGGKCVGEMPQTPVAGDLVINEVMPNAATKKPFENTGIASQCDFVEIVNTSNASVNLDNLTLTTIRIGGDEKVTPYVLSGVLRSKQAAVLHNCDGNFPNDILAIKNGLSLVNSADGYTISLTHGQSNELANVSFGKSTQGTSFNLTEDLVANNSELVLHDTVSSNGLKYSPGRCLNGASFANDCVDTCGNYQKDGNESDVDCGGSCAGCELEQACTSGSDCASNYCDENGTCAVAPCESNNDCGEGQTCTNKICVDKCANGIKDSDEADIDCGGSCALCDNGSTCTDPSQCINGECNSGICAGTPCEEPVLGELVINEVLGYLQSATAMNYSSNNQVEFIELYNTSSSKRIKVKDLAIDLIKLGDSGAKTISLATVDCLAPEHYLVLSGSELSLTGATAVSAKVSNVGFTDKMAYDIKLYHTGTSDIIHEASLPKCQECKKEEDGVCIEYKECTDSSRGVSYARTGGIYDDDTTKITLVPHNQLVYFSESVTENHSPGVDNFTSAVSVP